MKKTWLNGKTVIISGASSGIGLETARQLIDGYGCSVIGIAQNIAKLTKAKELLGSNFSYYSFDVKSEENWKNFRDNLLEKGIIPDILINNAGILPRFSRFEKYSDREIEDVLRINFLSAVYAVRTLLPLIGQSKTPAVINISSSAALAPVRRKFPLYGEQSRVKILYGVPATRVERAVCRVCLSGICQNGYIQKSEQRYFGQQTDRALLQSLRKNGAKARP